MGVSGAGNAGFAIVRTGRAAAQFERLNDAAAVAYLSCEEALRANPLDPRFTAEISGLEPYGEGDYAAVFDEFTLIYRMPEAELIEIIYIDCFLAEYDLDL